MTRNAGLIADDDLIDIFSLLSSMYLCKPEMGTLVKWRELLSGNNHALLSDLRKALLDIDMESDDARENLLWEYTRLFIGPYRLPCPPWESVYTSPKRLMMQDAADQVLALYREAGLAINVTDVMPDHVGAELNFLAILLKKILSQTEKDFYFGITERFLDEHLLRWLPSFTKDLEGSAETPLYRALARSTRNVIDFYLL